VALARALITNPQVLLLDEPLSALDPFLRIRMRTELKKLQRELGITFIHVTHGQDEALALADEIVVMNNAVIEQAGPARDVFNAPAHRFVARFIGGHNVMALPEGPLRHPRRRGQRPPPATGRIDAVVTAVEYQGTACRAPHPHRGRSGSHLSLIPEADFFAPPNNPGDIVRLTWDAAAPTQLTA
jgi:putative spermidine/putrescine transport system ATP-binding protein